MRGEGDPSGCTMLDHASSHAPVNGGASMHLGIQVVSGRCKRYAVRAAQRSCKLIPDLRQGHASALLAGCACMSSLHMELDKPLTCAPSSCLHTQRNSQSMGQTAVHRSSRAYMHAWTCWSAACAWTECLEAGAGWPGSANRHRRCWPPPRTPAAPSRLCCAIVAPACAAGGPCTDTRIAWACDCVCQAAGRLVDQVGAIGGREREAVCVHADLHAGRHPGRLVCQDQHAGEALGVQLLQAHAVHGVPFQLSFLHVPGVRAPPCSVKPLWQTGTAGVDGAEGCSRCCAVNPAGSRVDSPCCTS